MDRPIIWMFAGQGSHYYHMGRELFESDPVFRQTMEQGDRVITDLINESVVELIYRPRQNRFDPFRRLLHSHPAILLLECALAETLFQLGLRPQALLGYSLGELACQVVAGGLSLEDALVASVRQAEIIEYIAPRGVMLAILDTPDLAARYPAEFQGFAISARNFPKNFIVSGPVEAGLRLQGFLKGLGINFVELPVDYPFHSPLMEICRTPCQTLLSQLKFAEPRIPIISCAATTVDHPDAPGANVWHGMQAPVDFAGTIAAIEKQGGGRYIDLGPAGSMATAVKYNLAPGSTSDFFTLLSPFGRERENIGKMVAKLKEA